MKRTLLEGNIRRQLIGLMLPLLLGSILQQLYNTVDSLVIERYLGTQAFSAVGIAGTVMNLMIFILSGFCAGVTVILAQKYGQGDVERFRSEIFTAVVLGIGVTLLLSGTFMLLMRPILLLIHSPAELLPYLEDYLRIIVGGMLCTFLYNLCSGMLNAIGNTRMSTFFLLVAVVMNVFTDLLFVGKLRLGIAGAAWATVLSQLFSALCCMLYIVRKDRSLLCTRRDMRFDGALVRQTLVFGASSALHMSSLYIGKMLVQGAVNLLGTQGIAAYTAAMRIEGFANSFGASIGQALSVFTSQNFGAGKRARVRSGFRQGIAIGLGVGVVLSALMFLFAEPGVRIFLNARETQAIAYGVAYLHQIACVYFLCFSGNTFVGFFRGLGKMYVLLCATTLHISVRVVLSYLLVGSLGLRAVAIATGVGWICMTFYQAFTFVRLRRNGVF